MPFSLYLAAQCNINTISPFKFGKLSLQKIYLKHQILTRNEHDEKNIFNSYCSYHSNCSCNQLYIKP